MRSSNWLLPLAAVLWIASLFLPGIVYQGGSASEGASVGYQILLLGWGGFGIGIVAWYANLTAFIALMLERAKSYHSALMLAILSVALGLDSYTFRSEPLDEANAQRATVDHLSIGFYLWELSFILFTVYLYRKEKEQAATPLTAEEEKLKRRVHVFISIPFLILGGVYFLGVISLAFQLFFQKP